MSTAEEQELMAQISNLAGRINRHKAQQTGQPGYPNHATHSTRGAFRVAPYPHGSYRGVRGGRAPGYRNKTLVLNGQSRPTTNADDSTPTPTTPNGSWVTKTDRHLQLINSNVYEKESQNRANAIEQTQRNKVLRKDHAEKARLLNFLGKQPTTVVAPASNTTATPSSYEVTVDGIRFQVTRQGSKLVRAPGMLRRSQAILTRPCAENTTGDPNPPTATPRVTTIGGVKFFRTKNGNLIRHGVAKAQRLACGVKKVDELCKTFSWTGSCAKGPQCRFVHDPAKVAICRDWLLKGQCQKGDACDLSHDIAEERIPLCLHFANGNCRNEKCSYLHVEHSQTDLVCRPFGFCGWCDKGASCAERHVFECPDFSNTGVCKTKGCKHLHRERASMLRKAGNKDNAAQEGEISDLSSDDDDDDASNDIDSDEVEEFIGKDDEAQDLDFAAQKDYIGFA
ncbi:CCCH zinc finger protein [Apiospora marii]|uniref:CCCH zinc finger protein n=1 Tax=Apiospora marii TaxID=335849 RepID=A0ABR1SH21_9PEZI